MKTIQLTEEQERLLRDALTNLSFLSELLDQKPTQPVVVKVPNTQWKKGMKRPYVSLIEEILTYFGNQVIDRNDTALQDLVYNRRINFNSLVPTLRRLEDRGFCEMVYTKHDDIKRRRLVCFQLNIDCPQKQNL